MRAAILLVLLGFGVAHADTTQQNLAKYLRLRQRLRSDFVSVGTSPGQSEPAPERTDSAAMMKWGDGTIALGFYLGMLASEHVLLADPARFPGADGGDPGALAANEEELYDALGALERLDDVANAAFPPPCTTTPALDGFFVRDDVPADFASHFPGITTIQSDFIDPTLTNKEESQDQVYHVQHGLALVVALVPASVAVHGKPLRGWAIEQAQRITQHFAQGDWTIRNPACGDRAVNRGSSAIGYSYGETLAAQFVTDGAFTPTTDAVWANIWDSLRQPTNPAYSNESNLHMALAIMAVGDGYAADTQAVIAALAATQDWPLYPLLHCVLHPAATCDATSVQRARAMLDELPADGEPMCPGATPAVHGFTTHNRFIRGKAQAYVGPPGCDGIRYDGVDYMLLHNLYLIATTPPVVTADGASTTGVDAAVAGDASTTMTKPAGCGCRSSDGAPWWLAFAWLLRRRGASRRPH